MAGTEELNVTLARDVVQLTIDYIQYRYADITLYKLEPVFTSKFSMAKEERDAIGDLIKREGKIISCRTQPTGCLCCHYLELSTEV